MAITGKQRAARKRNIAIARKSKKKGSRKKRTTIDDASAAMKKKGFKLGKGKYDLKSNSTSYMVTTPKGKKGWVSAKNIMKHFG